MRKQLLLQRLSIMMMSGVDDGKVIEFRSDVDGEYSDNHWQLTIGRRDDNDLCLRKDTFVSRYHAILHWRTGEWWLEDCKSTNGTFTESDTNYFTDERIQGTIPIQAGQLFRVGRTWLRIQVEHS